MKSNNITIAIVGHTNTGKTSLVRALTRQRNFGDVKNAPATTIDVTNISLNSSDFTFNFVDTPGIEDAMSILELMPSASLQTSKSDEKKALLELMQNPNYKADFDQEFKVLNQMFKSDIAFYVIDVRQPFLPRYHYELILLLKTHIPILPILNFTQNAEYIDDWKRELKANGLHHYLEFDTILLPKKQRLYEQIAIMFPEHYQSIQSFIQTQNQLDDERMQQAMMLLADFYFDLMTLRIKADVKKVDAQNINAQIATAIAKIEKKFIDQLLDLYNFNREDIQHITLHTKANATTQDMFTLDEFGQFSIQFGKGAAAGATMMVGVDLISSMTTLGIASATGAVVGGVFSSLWNYGERIVDKWRDIEYFYIDQPTAVKLMLNLLYIIERLNDRSHADLNPIMINDETENSADIT
ncbi:MAG: GTPase/DUF3482 domain-containing protein, partial [Wohlfahrtiimonas sp.]